MKKIVSVMAVMAVMAVMVGVSYAGDVYVKGYYKSNGTYVAPHTRTAPDAYKWNNYSSPGGSSYQPGEQIYNNSYQQPRQRSYNSNTLGNTYSNPYKYKQKRNSQQPRKQMNTLGNLYGE